MQPNLQENKTTSKKVRRIFDYDKKLLPNRFIAALEDQSLDIKSARNYSGKSIGYPAWNLLYYSVLCSIDPGEESILIETGTNWGVSTIILGQALKEFWW